MNILFLNPTRRVELINMFKIYLKELGSSINVACYEAFDPTMHIADVGIHLQKNWRIKDLIAICQTYEISLIIPWLENDMINLLDNSNVLKDHNIKLAMNTSRHMHIAFSKKKTIDFLKELDVNVMPYMNRQKINKFPLVVKPDLGSGGIGVNVVNNEIELNNYLENDSTLIIQEYLNGVEYTVDLFCNKGKVLGSVPRKRVKFR
ncbi:ATP-grasp domain-containing protein, partial [Bacillus cereus]